MKRIVASALLIAAMLTTAASAQSAAPPISAQPVLMMVHVRVADMARSERFYSEVFGMSVTNAVSPREHVLRFADTPNTASGVILLLRGENSHGNGGFLVQVPDIDATFARVEAAGGAITRAPRPAAPNAIVRNGVMTDPDGAVIEVMQFVQR